MKYFENSLAGLVAYYLSILVGEFFLVKSSSDFDFEFRLEFSCELSRFLMNSPVNSFGVSVVNSLVNSFRICLENTS